MFAQESLLNAHPTETLAVGTVLQRRAAHMDEVIFVESGMVGLGVMGAGELEHCLGIAQGPCWLEPSAAVLRTACAVDAVTQSPVTIRRIPLAEFQGSLKACCEGVHSMLLDMARLHQQQTEVAVSRLVKDAEGRCAQWLIQHAHGKEGGHFVVEFHDRKRQVAQLLGIAPETLSRVFKLLRERGMISGTGRVLELVDMPALAELAGV